MKGECIVERAQLHIVILSAFSPTIKISGKIFEIPVGFIYDHQLLWMASKNATKVRSYLIGRCSLECIQLMDLKEKNFSIVLHECYWISNVRSVDNS